MFSRHVLKPENVVVEIIHYRCTYVVPGCCAYVCARFQKEKKNKTKQPDTSEFYAEKFRIEDPLERRASSVEHQASCISTRLRIVVYVSSSEKRTLPVLGR